MARRATTARPPTCCRPAPELALGTFLGLLALLVSLSLGGSPSQAQARPLVTLSATAGYDGYFRETPGGSWTPIRVRVDNQGGPLEAVLVIRPQTTGRVVANATRQALRLPANTTQDYILWIMPRRFPPLVTVELLAEDETRLAQAAASLTALPPEQPFYLVLTAADDLSPNLSQVVASGGERAAQAQWRAAQPPGRADLSAFTMILALEQPSADWEGPLRAYVAQGGHLILAGPALDLAQSPLQAAGTRSLDDLRPLARALQAFTQAAALPTTGRAVLANTSLADGARLLLALDGTPLIARRSLGAGTLDALAFDPRQQPWATWEGLPRLWWTLLASAPAAPSWQIGFNDSASAAQALAILPDLELLPPAAALAAFLGAYVLLIAPLNYLLLARLRRLEWAWLSFPLVIGGFTALAWTLGFNLRGDQTVLSRLAFVYAWGEDAAVQEAQAWGLAGILAPRRELVDVSAAPETRLSSFVGLNQSASAYQSSAALWPQAIGDSARGLALEGGIFANLQQAARLPDPRIRLELRVLPVEQNAFGIEQRPARVQGLILNGSPFTLEDGLLLLGQTAYLLNEPLAPGDSFSLLGDEVAWVDPPHAWPSRLELQSDSLPVLGLSARFGVSLGPPQRSGSANFIVNAYGLGEASADPAQARQQARRAAWLRAFLRDQYSALHPAHLATFIAWADELPPQLALTGRQWRSQDEALILVQAPLRFDEQAILQPWYFTWAMLERGGSLGGVDRLTLDAEQVAIVRFTPRQPLRQPSSIRLSAERGGGYGRSVQLALRDWTTGDFLAFGDASRDVYLINEDAERYIGPNGALDVRLTMANLAGSARVQDIAVQVEGLP